MPSTSVYQEFCVSVRRYAERPFLHIPAIASHSGAAVDYSYAAALEEVEQRLECYQATGLSQGDRVAILLENRVEFFFHWFALNALGVCVVPVNGEMQTQEITYLLDDSDARAVVVLPNKAAEIRVAVQAMDDVIPVVASDQISPIQFESKTTESAEAITTQTECALLYTSGSTGKPKGCILNNDYFLLSGAWYRDAIGYCELAMGKERLITPLPLVHMNAMACSTMGMMMSGGCVIQLDRFHPKSWWQTVRDSKASIIHYLGVMPAILLNMETGDDDFSQQVKFGFGAGVNSKHHAVFEQRFGFPLIEAWAMTETGCANCIIAWHEPRHLGTSCIGKAPENMCVKLVDELGETVPNGEPGELLVKAQGDDPRRGFFSGYYNNQAATDEAWQGGWLHTGDIVRQGTDGSYHFVDRIKNVIRRSGENISALEVEASLSLIDSIAQVAVTAVPDEIRGDEVCACLVLHKDNSGDEFLAKSIFEQAAQSLSYFKVPGYIAFVDELPLTASNKPQRAELKKLACEIVQRLANGEVTHATQCYDLRSLKKKR
jgi:acyl-coenzyme A synthetase/AMP-(fatty) acid ligase